MAHKVLTLAVPIGAVAVVLSVASLVQDPVHAAGKHVEACSRDTFLPVFAQLEGHIPADALSELRAHASFSDNDITNDDYAPRDQRGLFVLVTHPSNHAGSSVSFVEKKIEELPRPHCEADVTLESGGYVVMGVTRTNSSEVYLATPYARRPHPPGTT